MDQSADTRVVVDQSADALGDLSETIDTCCTKCSADIYDIITVSTRRSCASMGCFACFASTRVVMDETNKRLRLLYDKSTKAPQEAPREAATADEIKKRFSGEDMISSDGKWVLDCFLCAGGKYEGPPPKLVKGGLGTIQKCIEEFKANPKKYEAICFWEKAFIENYDPQECNMFPRAPGKTFPHVRNPAQTPNQRWQVYEWLASYKRLPAVNKNDWRDDVTD